MKEVRWGILGCGGIAGTFAKNCVLAEGAKLAACGSRTAEKAEEFGARYDIPHRHASYKALAEDTDVDAVYIATPHNFHMENMLLCIQNGKHVLCEKPFTLNAAHADRAIEAARARGVFLMEAMWTRFLPSAFKVRELLASGAIGKITSVQISFGFDAGENAGTESRLVSRHLAGGATLDVGIYVSSYASMIFGGIRPDAVAALSRTYEPTGVDGQTSFILGYGGNRLATLVCSIRSNVPDSAVINGTKGRLVIPRFWKNGDITLEQSSERTTWTFPPLRGTGFVEEIEHSMNCIREGRTESVIMPLAETRLLMETLDRVRACIGLKYPEEE